MYSTVGVINYLAGQVGGLVTGSWFVWFVLLVSSLVVLKWPQFRVLYLTIGRDLTSVLLLVRVKFAVSRASRLNATVFDLFRQCVVSHPNRVVFYCDGMAWTFLDVEQLSCRIANAFNDYGFKKGDEVALFAESCPEYVALWLGLSQIGVVTGLLNTGLKADSLAHSISVINARALVFGTEFKKEVADARYLLDVQCPGLAFFDFSGPMHLPRSTNLLSNTIDLNALISCASTERPKYEGNFSDKLLYIYTSGTTGLPKASIITNHKYILRSSMNFFPGIIGRLHTIYCPLPLYHSLAGNGGVGVALLYGHTLVMKRKFSTSDFWPDVQKYKCTMFLYVGELCRYLLAASEVPEEHNHDLELMIGVGLRPNLWNKFQTRFGGKIRIYESYGSTEANCQLINLTSKSGAIGFMPQLIPEFISRKYAPSFIIQVDLETGEPIRDSKTGLCYICRPSQVGCFVGRIVSGDLFLSFEGYVDRVASERKVIRDVLKQGDAFHLTGDLVVADELGYVYFHDRIGDTYRWKAENVSSAEVEAVMSRKIDLKTDVIVYGVRIPGCEGRAGMAAVCDPSGLFNPNSVIESLRNNLPSFAIPIFVRIIAKAPLTEGTFKYKKNVLKRDGYELKATGNDPMYMYDSSTLSYVHFDRKVETKLMDGLLKF